MSDIFVTGARGWIGGGVVRTLAARGLKIATATYEESLDSVAEKAARAKVVVHAGGVYSNARDKYVEQNIEQCVAVAKGAAKTANTVVFTSSVKVYGWQWSDDHVCDESDGGPAIDDFGRGKRMMEELFGVTAVRSLSLRIGNVYGPGSPTRYALGKMVHDAKTSKVMTLTCDGSSLRDFVHIDDVVKVICTAVLQSLHFDPVLPSHTAYNVVSGQRITLLQAAEVIQRYIPSAVQCKNGRVIHGPAMSNQRVRDIGFIDEFIAPIPGLESYLQVEAAR
jgi:nucleoside-diphosphate-sugar epimerase